MHRPNEETPAGRRALGESVVEKGIDGRQSSAQGATNELLAAHFCCCKPGVPCIFCLRWDRKIRAGNARRADPLWRQAPERRVVSGGF